MDIDGFLVTELIKQLCIINCQICISLTTLITENQRIIKLVGSWGQKHSLKNLKVICSTIRMKIIQIRLTYTNALIKN